MRYQGLNNRKYFISFNNIIIYSEKQFPFMIRLNGNCNAQKTLTEKKVKPILSEIILFLMSLYFN